MFKVHTNFKETTLTIAGRPIKQKPRLLTMDEIEEGEVTWLWYPYIPVGAVTVMYGPGGIGKSHITCDIAARISRGDPMPGSDGVHAPQKVLMLSAEDDYSKVLKPRLRRAGAKMENIGVPDDQFVLDKEGIRFIAEYIKEFAVTVVFIDPIVYYAGGKMDINRSNEVRDMMKQLFDIAGAADTAVIAVGHIRKSSEGSDADRMMGSADWINASRSGLFVTTDNEGKPIMRHAKHNWGPKGNSWLFALEEDGFEWTGTIDDRMLANSNVNKGRASEKAITFLMTVLQNGPVESNELMAMAADEKISPATLNRVKKSVAESFYGKETKQFYWRLLAPQDLIVNGKAKRDEE